MADRAPADGKPAPNDKLNVTWHMKDMADDVQRHSAEAFGGMGRHAKDMAGELQQHAQGSLGDVGRHSQAAAVEVRREIPVLIEHVKDTILDLFGNVRHPAARK